MSWMPHILGLGSHLETIQPGVTNHEKPSFSLQEAVPLTTAERVGHGDVFAKWLLSFLYSCYSILPGVLKIVYTLD